MCFLIVIVIDLLENDDDYEKTTELDGKDGWGTLP
jgi:hypothetical protein